MALITTPCFYTTHTPALLELRLAVEYTRREYAVACVDRDRIWQLQSEGAGEVDRDAQVLLNGMADKAEAYALEAWQAMNDAEAALLAVLS